jgi:hypothetical protein
VCGRYYLLFDHPSQNELSETIQELMQPIEQVGYRALRTTRYTFVAQIQSDSVNIKSRRQTGVTMEKAKCAVKKSLEEKVRNAVIYEKGLESKLPESETRKDAGEEVERASAQLKNHLANCSVCASDTH